MKFEQFRKMVSEAAKVPLNQVHEEASIRDELGIDSLQFVNLLVEISHRFGIELSGIESLEEIRTVGLLYRAMMKGE